MHPAVAWVFLFFFLWSHGNPAVLTCLLFSDSVREMEQFSGFVVSFLICSWRQNNPAVSELLFLICSWGHSLAAGFEFLRLGHSDQIVT